MTCAFAEAQTLRGTVAIPGHIGSDGASLLGVLPAVEASPDEPSATTTRHRRALRGLLIAVVVGVLAVEVVAISPYLGRATRSLSNPRFGWLTAALAAELVSMAAFAHLQRRMVSAGGTRISIHRMVMLVYSSNAVSVSLPAGPALASGYTFRRLRGWGATVPLATFALIASGVLSTLAFGLLGVFAVALAGGGGDNSLTLALGLGLTFGAALIARALLHRPHLIGQIAGRGLSAVNRLRRRDAEFGQAGLRRAIDDLLLIRPRRQDWLAGLSFAALNWAADLVCLIACTRAVGASSNTGDTVAVVVLAYVAGMSASGISLLPGGLGVTDAAMILVLSHGGYGIASATAAVLLYRLVSYVFIAAAGWIVMSLGFYVSHRSAGRDRRIAAGTVRQPTRQNLDAASRTADRPWRQLGGAATQPR
jgi:putative heme transporter